MKRFAAISAITAMLLSVSPAHTQELENKESESSDLSYFQGDVALACEAILCLSSGTRPGECSPSLQRYFSIVYKKLSDTIRGRLDFLNLCPAASYDSNMRSLVDSIANGAGRCDTASLNSHLRYWGGDDAPTYISNAMPSYCTRYHSNSYTDLVLPKYVGTPERGGFWVDADKYEKALAEYNKRIAAEDSENRNNGWRNR